MRKPPRPEDLTELVDSDGMNLLERLLPCLGVEAAEMDGDAVTDVCVWLTCAGQSPIDLTPMLDREDRAEAARALQRAWDLEAEAVAS